MKVFWVVAWDQHYPASKLHNVQSTHETAGEAIVEARQILLHYDYVEVLDVSRYLGLPTGENWKEVVWRKT